VRNLQPTKPRHRERLLCEAIFLRSTRDKFSPNVAKVLVGHIVD